MVYLDGKITKLYRLHKKSSSKEVVFTISLIYNKNNNGPKIDP